MQGSCDLKGPTRACSLCRGALIPAGPQESRSPSLVCPIPLGRAEWKLGFISRYCSVYCYRILANQTRKGGPMKRKTLALVAVFVTLSALSVQSLGADPRA